MKLRTVLHNENLRVKVHKDCPHQIKYVPSCRKFDKFVVNGSKVCFLLLCHSLTLYNTNWHESFSSSIILVAANGPI